MIDETADDRTQLNQWVSDLQAEIEFEPLRNFLERLKEPEPELETEEIEVSP
jgi:hypothetical protein